MRTNLPVFRSLFWTSFAALFLNITGIIPVLNLPSAIPIARADNGSISYSEAPNQMIPQNFTLETGTNNGTSADIKLSWKPPKSGLSQKIGDVQVCFHRGTFPPVPLTWPYVPSWSFVAYTIIRSDSEKTDKTDEPWKGGLTFDTNMVVDSIPISPDHDTQIQYKLQATYYSDYDCPFSNATINSSFVTRNVTVTKQGKVILNDSSSTIDSHRPRNLKADYAWNGTGWNVDLSWEAPAVNPDGVPKYQPIYRQRQVEEGKPTPNFQVWAQINKGIDGLKGTHIVNAPSTPKTRIDLEYSIVANFTDKTLGDTMSNTLELSLAVDDQGNPTDNGGHKEATKAPPAPDIVINQSTVLDEPANLSTCNCEKQQQDSLVLAAIGRSFCYSLCTISRALGILACFLIGNIVDPLFNRVAGASGGTCDPTNIDTTTSTILNPQALPRGGQTSTSPPTTTNPSSSPSDSGQSGGTGSGGSAEGGGGGSI